MGRDKASPAPAPKAVAPADPGPPKPAAKGHRQKGAGAVTKDKGPVERGGVEVQSWQRIPSQLLHELCQREKRPRPMYFAKGCPSGVFREEVVVPDGKTKERDLRFCPVQAFESQVLAKEHAAMLALLHLQGNLPLERKLPEPYRTTWLLAVQTQAEEAKAAGKKGKEEAKGPNPPARRADPPASGATSSPPAPAAVGPAPAKADGADSSALLMPAPFAASSNAAGGSGCAKPKAAVVEGLGSAYRHASRQAQQQENMAQRIERNRRHAEREAARRARGEDAAVFMSSGMRQRLERVLGLGAEDGLLAAAGESSVDLTQCPATTELRQMGFADRHIRSACAALGTDAELDAILGWLCLQLPEDALPKRFQAYGQTLDLQARGGSPGVASPTDAAQLSDAQAEVAAALRTYGFRTVDCAAAVSATMDVWEAAGPDVQYRCLQPLVAVLQARSAGPPPPDDAADAGHGEEDCFAEERVALESILEEGLEVSQWDGLQKVTMQLDAHHALDAFLPPGYPRQAPHVLVRSRRPMQGAAAYVKLQGILAAHAASLLGTPMLYELYGFAKAQVDALVTVPGAEGPLLLAGRPPPTPSRSPPTPSDAPLPTSSPATPVATEAEESTTGQGRYHRESGWWAAAASASPPRKAALISSPAVRRMAEYRSALPAAKAQAEFMALLAGNQVVLVAGETGCGKTTQIPQFVLDGAEAQPVKVVVAQPRRIAAVSVATRVAEERGERVGQTAGYHVRGDACYGAATRLLFCTTGIVLRQLQNSPTLAGVTHVIIDEVHERHLDGDFLMALLHRLLAQGSHLKVVLMSATMDTTKLAAYFRGRAGPSPPVLHIPGFTHPVEEYGLDFILQRTRYSPERRPGKDGGDGDASAEEGPVLQDSRIDYRLLCCAVDHLCAGTLPAPDGAVLIFLPGAGEIARLCDDLRRLPHPLFVLPLHGGLTPSDQQKVFQPAPAGQRKVVVSTNIAETSITIPDITVVIDTGRVKETGYDPLNNIPCLTETWAPRDSLRQRRGRAGRVRPGVCYRTLYDATFQALPVHGRPEIQRTALDQLVLQVKALGLGDPRAFLRGTLDPPSDAAVTAAFRVLQEVQALDEAGELTPQGWHQAALPAPVRISKMLLYGAVLGVLDPVLSIAAGLVVRPPFLAGAREAADRAKDRLCGTVGRSDHLVLAQLYSEWEAAGDRRRFCREAGVSMERLMEMRELRRDFARDLRSLGFGGSPNRSGLAPEAGTGHWRLVRAAVCLGLYMNVVQVRRGAEKFVETLHGAASVDPEAKAIKFFIRSDHTGQAADNGAEPERSPGRQRVFLHPSSVLFKSRKVSNWLVYHSIAQTSKLFVSEGTEVSPYALLLAARDTQVLPLRSKMVLDGWIWLTAAPRIATLMGALRARVWELLLQKLETPALDIGAAEEVQLLLRVLAADGMG